MTAPRTARRAAVDIGTNSVRLLVVEPDGTPVRRELEITRLGAGVDRNGRLDDAAVERTLAVLRRYRDTWQRLGATPTRIAATSAVRDAADRDRFLAAVRELTGVEPEVLTGQEEATLTFRGAVGAVTAPRPCTVMDIGGGSTELIVGDDHDRVRGAVSLQLGCVRLTERCLHHDPPTADELDRARAEVAAALDHAERVLSAAGAHLGDARTLIGVAGTVTTLAALHLGLDRYDPTRIHGTVLPTAGVRTLLDRLVALPAAARRELGPIQPGREDVIVGGALILLGVLERCRADAVVASEADILDGLAAGPPPAAG